MAIKSNCRGCLTSEIGSMEQVEQLVKEQLQFETDLVSDEIYFKRLQACEKCPSLSSQTTCSHCGCFVQFRAKLAYKKCPLPFGAKW